MGMLRSFICVLCSLVSRIDSSYNTILTKQGPDSALSLFTLCHQMQDQSVLGENTVFEDGSFLMKNLVDTSPES